MYASGFYVLSFAMLRLDCRGEEIEIKMYPEQVVSHVTVSSNATVICEASGLGGKAVTWSHLEKQIANVAADTVIFSDPTNQKRYEIGKGGTNAGNFTFTILGFSIQDSGFVSCSVIGVDPQRIQLEAFVLPESTSLRVESGYRETIWNGSVNAKILDLQDGVTFSCSVVNSRPKAVIEWKWNGLKITENISSTAESSMDMYNVTSYVTIPASTFAFSAMQDILNKERPNVTSVENVGGGETGHQTVVVTKEETTIPKPTGEISCKASVGSQSYVVTETILLTDYDTSGISCLANDWGLTAPVAVLTYLLLCLTTL